MPCTMVRSMCSDKTLVHKFEFGSLKAEFNYLSGLHSTGKLSLGESFCLLGRCQWATAIKTGDDHLLEPKANGPRRGALIDIQSSPLAVNWHN